MKITIAVNKPATESFVEGIDDLNELVLPPLYFGDVFELKVEPVDGLGGLADFVGKADVSLNAGIGLPASRLNYSSNPLSYNTNGYYSGIISLNTASLASAIDGESSISAYLEINASYYGGDKKTLLQMPVQINNQLIT